MAVAVMVAAAVSMTTMVAAAVSVTTMVTVTTVPMSMAVSMVPVASMSAVPVAMTVAVSMVMTVTSMTMTPVRRGGCGGSKGEGHCSRESCQQNFHLNGIVWFSLGRLF